MLDTLSNYSLPGKTALIVTSSGTSHITNGALSRLETQLNRAGVSHTQFAGISANPTRESVMDGAATAREHNADLIVALGGGSVIDASKAIALMATNSGDIYDYIEGGTGKGLTPQNGPLPIVAVNTTAGTGSEADKYGVISSHQTNEKMAFGGDDRLYPTITVVDPALMTGIPASQTAYQGFDALFHAMECYLNVGHNLMSDTYAARNIELVGKYLARAVQNGEDLEAREGMAFASYIAGSCMMCSGTIAAHALEHAMSAYHPSLPHGAGLIIIAEAFYREIASNPENELRLVKMAQLLGNEAASTADDFIFTLTELMARCGVSDLRMSDYGIRPEEFRAFAENAYATMGGAFEVSPLDFSRERCVAVYQCSYR